MTCINLSNIIIADIIASSSLDICYRATVFISNFMFLNCYGGEYGCIYFESDLANIQKLCFESCYGKGAGCSLYTKNTDTIVSLVSLKSCSGIDKDLPFDTFYINCGSTNISMVNVSYCTATDCTAVQINSNSEAYVSYVHAANGVGNDSIEISRQKVDVHFSRSNVVNNSVTQAVFKIFESSKIYITDVIISNNSIKAFTNCDAYFNGCYYCGVYPLGLSDENPNGIEKICSNFEWTTQRFAKDDCFWKENCLETLRGNTHFSQVSTLFIINYLYKYFMIFQN